MATFGGPWTEQKLEILRRYLDAYTTALKNRLFSLVYVDAFAGEGTWQPNSEYQGNVYGEFRELHDGSARIALGVSDKQFDRLVLIEKEQKRSARLEAIKKEFPDRNIEIVNSDANVALPWVCDSLSNRDRAVVFLDPYATEVSWETVEALAKTQKIDCWILFPLSAIARMMPRQGEPPEEWKRKLDKIFGDRSHWADFYQPSRQLSMLGDEPQLVRHQGSEQIATRYRERLESVFSRVAPSPRTLVNSTNAPLFELFFAASNPRGADIAVKIANHILTKW